MIITSAMRTKQTVATALSQHITAGQEIKQHLAEAWGESIGDAAACDDIVLYLPLPRLKYIRGQRRRMVGVAGDARVEYGMAEGGNRISTNLKAST